MLPKSALPLPGSKSKIPILTKKERERARATGDIRGWYAGRKMGAPKKIKEGEPVPPPDTVAVVSAVAGASVSSVSSTSSKNSRKVVVWNSEENFEPLREAVLLASRHEEAQDASWASSRVPRTTLQRMAKRFEEAAADHGVSLDKVTREMVYPNPTVGLLSETQVLFLAEIIQSRTNWNIPPTRAEVVEAVMQLSQCGNRKKCIDHYDYLVKMKRLESLKNGGKVVTAQPTTNKRAGITVEQQLRWMETIEYAAAELRRLNKPSNVFKELEEHFWGNLDETCLMSNEGTVKVVAAAEKRKIEKVMDDNRISITAVRVGFASGQQGPVVFLAKGTKDPPPYAKKCVANTAPSGSFIVMTANVFMTDDAWMGLVPKLCKAIRQLPVIRDHPDWWVAITLDGFGSHINCASAQEVFADNFILLVKEEGDTSQVNQPYDQAVAKQDKRLMRSTLDTV